MSAFEQLKVMDVLAFQFPGTCQKFFLTKERRNECCQRATVDGGGKDYMSNNNVFFSVNTGILVFPFFFRLHLSQTNLSFLTSIVKCVGVNSIAVTEQSGRK